MAQKFGRKYKLTIYPVDGGDAIIIELPFTVTFNCTRNVNASINNLDIDIYNLSDAHRIRIYQDLYVPGEYAENQVNPDGKPTISFNILLEAGYSQLYTVFYGRMMQASSAREGTNIVTSIHATDSLLDLSGSQIQSTIKGGQTVAQVMQYLINQFPNMTIGYIGNFPKTMTRPVVLNGLTYDILKMYSSAKVFIDNGVVSIVNDNEILPKSTTIDDSTGILETPRRALNTIIVKTLMETSIDTVCQQVNIASVIQPIYNGSYKAIGISHQGTISAAVSGKMTSSFVLAAPGAFHGFTTLKPGLQTS